MASGGQHDGNLRALQRRRAAEARQRKRRRGQMRLAGLGGVLLILAIILTSSGGRSDARARAHEPSENAATAHATAADRTGAAEHAGASDPLSTAALRRLLRSRQGDVSAALYDVTTHQEWLLNPSARDQTASIVKADILETVLYENQENGDPVADAESDTAEDMIEESDNDDAQALWNQIGGASGLASYDARAGLRDTTPGADGYWGVTLTSAADQIKVLRQLLPTSHLLSAASKAYQLSLMEQVDPGENWGVTAGVPAGGVTVALKNGWVTLTSDTDWEVNSIGWIDGDGHDYLLAVLTAHDPSEDYGIDTIQALSARVYDSLGPAAAAGTATIAQGTTPDD